MKNKRIQNVTLFLLFLLQGFTALAQQKMSNLVAFVSFPDDETSFTDNSLSHYERMFNDRTAGANSVYTYFKHSSYGQLDWTTTFVGQNGTDKIVSYQAKFPRGYYRIKGEINTIGYKDDTEKSLRERELIDEVAAYMKSKLSDGSTFDANNDGLIDNVVIVLSGRSDISAKYLLWPHRSDIALPTLRGIDFLGKKISGYIMVFDEANGFGKAFAPIPLSTGLLCHEMSHSLGTWDLYHVVGNLNPVGVWDLMSDNQTVPQQMMVYTKMKYCKWLDESDITTITQPGTYTLNPVGGTSKQNIAYKIQPIGSEEYFLVEYRKKEGYDASIPESGLLVYRINPKFSKGNVNYNGTTILDEQYIFRPGGTTTTDGNIREAAFSADKGKTLFGENANVRPFYSDGTEARFTLSNISMAGETISFTYTPGAKRILPSKTDIELGGTAESNVAISVASDDNWQITGLPQWLTASTTGGTSGNTSVTIKTTASNETVKTREATLTFVSVTDPNLTTTMVVRQLSNVVSAPEQLIATQAEDGIHLSWIAKTGGLLLSENFEDTTNPNGWTMTNTDTKGWKWQKHTSLYPAREGRGYSASLYKSWEDNEVNENQRLESPVFAQGKTLSFYSRSNAALRDFTASQQYYWVEVSKDGGNTWTKVFDVSTDYPVGNDGKPAYRDYVKISVDLSDYLSNQMKVRFRAFDTKDGVQFGWAIDDVEIYAAQSSANITGYNVYRNGVLIAGNLPSPTYIDKQPVNGDNAYTVTAISSMGESSPSAVANVNTSTTGIHKLTTMPAKTIEVYTIEGQRIAEKDMLSGRVYVIKIIDTNGKTATRKVMKH